MGKLRLASQVVLSFVVAGAVVASVFFGTSILQNLHLQYIRYQSKDIVTLLNERGGGGTGFVIKSPKGDLYILTNRHICRSTQSGKLFAIYREDTYLVNIVREYDLNDLCLVKAPESVHSHLKIAKSISLGERVFAVGHPLLEPITVTEGEISSNVTISMPEGYNVGPKDCSKPGMHLEDLSENPFALFVGIRNVCIQDYDSQSSTLSIQPGNSGSPVLNIYGSVSAVVFAANESGTHSYLVPLSAIKDFLNAF